MPDDYILRAEGLVKVFPGVLALNDVDFEVAPNETVGLAGANGAGKSTLIKILSGIYQPNHGRLFFAGKEVSISSPRKAHMLGINTTYQEINLIPYLTVSDNIFLGQEILRRRLGSASVIDKERQAKSADKLLGELGMSHLVTANMKVSELGGMQRGIIQIAKAVVRQSHLLIMDEPTSFLSKKEASILFETISRLRATESRLGIVFISHHLEEFEQICDRAVVLRDGRRVGTLTGKEMSVRALSELMIGHSVEKVGKTTRANSNRTILEIENLSVNGILHDICLNLNRGEIVGLTGLVGSGKSEFLSAIFGHLRSDSGLIKLDGKQVEIRSPKHAIGCGIGLVPEERKLQGLFLNMMIQENITIAGLDRVSKLGVISKRKQADISKAFIGEFSIEASGPFQIVGTLSGGNQQKVVISKWMMLKPRILLLDEVTRGIDIGAKAEVWKLVKRMAEGGMTVILASSEVDEVLALSDRVVVMAKGSIVGERISAETNRAEILKMCLEKADQKGIEGNCPDSTGGLEAGTAEGSDTSYVKRLEHEMDHSPPKRFSLSETAIGRIVENMQGMLARQPLVLILLALVVFMSILIPRFFTLRNFESNSFQLVSIGFIVLGELLVILSGGIDLSVGSVMAFSACLMSGLIVKSDVSIPVALFLATSSGALSGLVCGTAVTVLKVTPFVATLGVMGIMRGLVLIYTGRAPISGLPMFFETLGSGSFYGVPIPTVILCITAMAVFVLLTYTKTGINIYAIGGNEEAAYLSGVPVMKTKIFVYCASGVLSSIAGIFMAARLVSAQPLMGLGWELNAITAVVIGGTSLMGGVGTLGGALLGLLIVQVITNGMNLMNILMYFQQIITGIILLGSLVAINWRSFVHGKRKSIE